MRCLSSFNYENICHVEHLLAGTIQPAFDVKVLFSGGDEFRTAVVADGTWNAVPVGSTCRWRSIVTSMTIVT